MFDIVMAPDYGSVFICESGDDTGTTIGDEESITIDDKTIEFNLPELQNWTSEYLWQVLVPCESGEKTIEEINEIFDWKDFHKRGLELAHKVKKLLPKNVRLRYASPFEDRSGIISDEMWVE